MVSSNRNTSHQKTCGTVFDMPDISLYCSLDPDEVLHLEKKERMQQTIKCNHHPILYKNPADFFDILPPEVVLQILKYLDVQSLFNSSQVCTKWHNVIENTGWLWKWLCEHYCDFREDIQHDIQAGYSWQVIFKRYFRHHAVRRKWLNGSFSNVKSWESLPQRSMTHLNRDEWGNILDAELLRGPEM